MFFEGGSSKFGDAENMEFKLEGLNVNRYQMLHTQMALQNPLPCQDTLKPLTEEGNTLFNVNTKRSCWKTKRLRTSSANDDDDNEDLSKPTFSKGNIDKTMKCYQKEGR